jgi:hypothetical protein
MSAADDIRRCVLREMRSDVNRTLATLERLAKSPDVGELVCRLLTTSELPMLGGWYLSECGWTRDPSPPPLDAMHYIARLVSYHVIDDGHVGIVWYRYEYPHGRGWVLCDADDDGALPCLSVAVDSDTYPAATPADILAALDVHEAAQAASADWLYEFDDDALEVGEALVLCRALVAGWRS